MIQGTSGNDVILGTDAGDLIFGDPFNGFVYSGSGDDSINGGLGNDKIFGGPGNDTIIGGGGNDELYGGLGTDIAVYNKSSIDYLIEKDGPIVKVTDRSTSEYDYLLEFEKIQFTDQIIEISFQDFSNINIEDQKSLIADNVAALMYPGSPRLPGSTITYSFEQVSFQNNPAKVPAGETYLFTEISSELKQFYRETFEYLTTLLGVDFVEAAAGSGATIKIGAHNMTVGGYGYPPSSSNAGHILLNSDYLSSKTMGSYIYMAAIHELGHSLGLEHTEDRATTESPGAGSSAPFVTAEMDSQALSIMSYWSYTVNYKYLSTFSPLDISALRYLYGTNSTPGDTKWSVIYSRGASTSGVTHDFGEESATIYAYSPSVIYDVGGNDSIDLTNFLDPAVIDLEKNAIFHSWSDQGILRLNSLETGAYPFPFIFDENHPILRIDPSTVIESYIGTGYADRFICGNYDVGIDGGVGVDTFVLSNIAANYTLDFDGRRIGVDRLVDSGETGTLTSVELLQFADRLVHIASSTPTYDYTDLPDELYQFFIVAFGATPGVTYMDQLAEAYQYFEPQMGKDAAIQTIVDIFTTKSQYLDLYPDISTLQDRTNLVEDIVKSSASATAKAGAVQDIGDALAAGWSVGKVIYTVFGNLANKPQSDATWGGTAKQFANELAVANYYTEVLHQSTDDVDTLRDVLKLVGSDSDVSSDAAIVELIGVGLLQA